jgi:hypothetical protein
MGGTGCVEFKTADFSRTAQFLSSVEKELAHFDAQMFTKLSKRGGAEPAEEIAESLAVSLMLFWGLTTRFQSLNSVNDLVFDAVASKLNSPKVRSS